MDTFFVIPYQQQISTFLSVVTSGDVLGVKPTKKFFPEKQSTTKFFRARISQITKMNFFLGHPDINKSELFSTSIREDLF